MDNYYWKVIALCNKGLIFKRIACKLLGVSYDQILKDCKNPIEKPEVISGIIINKTTTDIEDLKRQLKEARKKIKRFIS